MNTETKGIENINLKTPETEQGDALIRDIVKLQNYDDLSYSIVTAEQNEALVKKIESFTNNLPEVKDPQNSQEVVLAEMRRRLKVETENLLSRVSPEAPSLEEIVRIYNIPEQDLAGIELWLKDNIEKVRETNDRLLQNAGNLTPLRYVDIGIEELRFRAQNAVGRHIEILKDILRDGFPGMPGIAMLLDRYLVAMNIRDSRSYINSDTHVLSIGVSDCARIYQNEVFVIPEKIVELMGHEGFGHGQHFMVTENALFLPEFLRRHTGPALKATKESVAQHFERRFFDYLESHPKASTQLEFQEDFAQIRQRYLDRQLLDEYWFNLANYGRLTLARNGKPELKNGKPANDATQIIMDELRKYSLDPQWPTRFIKRKETAWDPITGRLSRNEVSELRYVTNSVRRIMQKVPPEQVEKAEKLILTGLWTPEGLEQWVKVNLATANPNDQPNLDTTRKLI